MNMYFLFSYDFEVENNFYGKNILKYFLLGTNC